MTPLACALTTRIWRHGDTEKGQELGTSLPVQSSLGPFGPAIPKKSRTCLTPARLDPEKSPKSWERCGKSPKSFQQVSKESLSAFGLFPRLFGDFPSASGTGTFSWLFFGIRAQMARETPVRCGRVPNPRKTKRRKKGKLPSNLIHTKGKSLELGDARSIRESFCESEEGVRLPRERGWPPGKFGKLPGKSGELPGKSGKLPGNPWIAVKFHSERTSGEVAEKLPGKFGELLGKSRDFPEARGSLTSSQRLAKFVSQSRRKRNLTHEWVHEWPHEWVHEWPHEAAHESAHESPHEGWFPFEDSRALPTKAPTKHPTKVSTEVPTSGRSGFTCPVFTCPVLRPWTDIFETTSRLFGLPCPSNDPKNSPDPKKPPKRSWGGKGPSKWGG